MPLIVSNRIEKLRPQFFWMGGGHPDVKMRLSLEEFKIGYSDKVLVEDITYEDEAWSKNINLAYLSRWIQIII